MPCPKMVAFSLPQLGAANWLFGTYPMVRKSARKKLAESYGYLQYDSVQDRFLWGDATYDGVTVLKSIEVGKTRPTSAP